MSDFVNVIQQAKSKYPDEVSEITSLYKQKLWHELTTVLRNFFMKAPYELSMAVYDEMIKDFELKLNPIRLAEMLSLLTRKNKDKKNCILILQACSDRIEKRNKSRNDANYLIDCEIAFNHIKLAQNCYTRLAQNPSDAELSTKFETYQKNAKMLLNATEKYTSSQPVVPLELNAKYHSVRAELMKIQNELKSYYSEALLSIAYQSTDSIPPSERKKLAYDLAIAALIGEVYQFGELIHHPILSSLESTPFSFLVDLLRVFHAGDISQYHSLSHHLDAVPTLKSKEAFLHKKLQLMSLLNLVYSRIPEQRVITFDEIRRHTKVEDVELLCLKALSLVLVKGLIDEVQKTVYISWCQPKVLNRSELGSLHSKVKMWHARVQDVQSFVSIQQNVSS